MHTENLEQIMFTQADMCLLHSISNYGLSRYITKKNIDNNQIIPSHNISTKRKKYSFETTRTIIHDLYSKHLKSIAKVQVFFNFKGGTGKTTICHQTSVMFALYGFKILVIDCDAQAHLSASFGFNVNEDYKTIYDVIVNRLPIEECINPVYPGLDVIPSNLSLTRVENNLNQMANREKVFNKILESVKSEYDFIFIDTNPTISTLNRNATIAADIINIICETQPYSLKALEVVISEIESLEQAMEQKINYQIIANKYDSKTVISQESLGILHSKYKEKVVDSIVRKCEDMNISAKRSIPLFGFCNRKSIALEDIIDLTKKMINRSTVNIDGDLYNAA